MTVNSLKKKNLEFEKKNEHIYLHKQKTKKWAI